MKKTLKRAGSLLLAGAMAASLAACGGSGSSAAGGSESTAGASNAGAPEETTLKIYLFGQAEDFDKVVEKFEAETADTLNIKLDIVWSDSQTHRE